MTDVPQDRPDQDSPPKPTPTCEVLQRLALPFGLHLTYLTDSDTMKVGGNLDFANTDHIALAAGILGAELCFVNWSDITDTKYIVVKFTQFITAVLRGFANALECGDLSFSGSTVDGLLLLSFRAMEKDVDNAEKSEDPENPNSDAT